jgi:membrane-associated phospholipid phosphatase
VAAFHRLRLLRLICGGTQNRSIAVHRDPDVPALVPGIDESVGLGDFLERETPSDEDPQLDPWPAPSPCPRPASGPMRERSSGSWTTPRAQVGADHVEGRTMEADRARSRVRISYERGMGLPGLLAIVGLTVVAEPPEATRSSAAPSAADRHRSVYSVRWPIDVPVSVVGGLMVALPYDLGGGLIRERCPCDPSQVNPIDRGVIGNHSAAANRISDVSVGLALIAPIILDAVDVGTSHDLVEDMLVYAEALAVNGALVTVAKWAVQRPLPVVYSGDAPELVNAPGGYRSFYSGHTSNAVTALMAASMTYTLRHGETWWPWVVTGAFGFSVGAERVAAGRHFYTDVAVGALAGVLVGWLIPRIHERTGAAVAVAPAAEDAVER